MNRPKRKTRIIPIRVNTPAKKEAFVKTILQLSTEEKLRIEKRLKQSMRIGLSLLPVRNKVYLINRAVKHELISRIRLEGDVPPPQITKCSKSSK